jgi:glucose/arabinose dehydrogenase
MRRRPILVALAVTALLTGCSGSAGAPGTGTPQTDRAAAVGGPGPLVPTTVTVPAAYRQAPFDVPRRLSLPRGWTVSVLTRIPGARFLSFVGGFDDLLVSQPSTGRVLLVRRSATGTATVTPWLTGLNSPHDIVSTRQGSTRWVYVAESTRVVRYLWTKGAARPGSSQVVVTGLPTGGHGFKNIAVVGGALYVSIGSSCNVCASDTTANPKRAAIYRYPLAGGTGTLVVTGLRNAEGLAEVPGTGALWAVTNNRDQITYPLHRDITGDGQDDYGKVIPAYVDDHPMEPFVHVEQGTFFGWPFCNPTQDTAAGNREMPLQADPETNADGHVNCATAEKVNFGIQAHSAPLGLTFLQGTAVPVALRTGAAVALHGSWNRTRRTGYKVVWFDWRGTDGGGRPGTQQDLATGWVSADGQDVWGRPVDVAADSDGSLLVTDDQSGTVYRLSPPR